MSYWRVKLKNKSIKKWKKLSQLGLTCQIHDLGLQIRITPPHREKKKWNSISNQSNSEGWNWKINQFEKAREKNTTQINSRSLSWDQKKFIENK